MAYEIQLRINFVTFKELSNSMTAEFAPHKNLLCIQDYLPLQNRILQLPLWNTVCGLLKGIQIGNKHPTTFTESKGSSPQTQQPNTYHTTMQFCPVNQLMLYLF